MSLAPAASEKWQVAPESGTSAALSRQELYALLNEANTAFQQANAAVADSAVARQSYDRAILLYEKIIDQGGVQNAGLYYNLANAYLLKDDLGRAILNYRRAEGLVRAGFKPGPTDLDLNVKKNLAFARSRRVDRVETAAPKRVLETLFFWHYDLSLRTKLLLACLAFAAACISATIMVWLGPDGRKVNVARQKVRRVEGERVSMEEDKTLRPSDPLNFSPSGLSVGLVLSAVLTLLLLASLLLESHRQSTMRLGVITAAEVVARQGDGPNYPPSFQDPLHAGTEFEILAQRPGWFHIRLADGADAWIPADAAGEV